MLGFNVLPLEGVEIIIPQSRRFLLKLVNNLRDRACAPVVISGVPASSLSGLERGPGLAKKPLTLGSHGRSTPKLDNRENGRVRSHAHVALELCFGSNRIAEEKGCKAFSGEGVHCGGSVGVMVGGGWVRFCQV